MKLVKTIDNGWAITKYYDLGASATKFGGSFDRKILVVNLLETGQESKSRYRGSIEVEYNGNVRIETAIKPYSEKVKGFDY
tara:strand:- start:59 stop:301 length:243 start_codon:yes stop_codon:yes gene_type:complete